MSKSGTRAWLFLALYITGYDIYASLTGRETLSSAFWRAVQHPKNRWGVIALWAYITCHLFHAIPDKYDPLRRLDKPLKLLYR